MNFRQYNKNIPVKNATAGVESIDVSLVIDDADGQVNVTDLILQGGKVSTIWELHPTEIRWSHDE